MALPHESTPTIEPIEFIQLTPLDISPTIGKAETKVFYLGKNRNGSFIDKPTALEMAKSLRGAPVVGYWKEPDGDFGGHGQELVINDDGIEFRCLTKPLGFVPTDAEVWFKTFTEIDDFGESVEREYMMTTVYLWKDQFPENQKVLDEGQAQSMELGNVDGHWSTDQAGMDYFIISTATIDKLCILGDNTEPCFEGASVTSPNISSNFSLENNFKEELTKMMEQIQFALKGGNEMDNENVNVTPEENTPSEPETTFENEEVTQEEKVVTPVEDFEKKDDDEEDEKDSEDNSTSEDDNNNDDEEEKKEPEKKHSLHTDEEYDALQAKFDELEVQFSAMKEENEKLVEFKNVVEDREKDELIARFYMLDDEDKKDIIKNKRNYSLDEIEAKLAVIGYHKGVNFNSENTSKNDDNVETVTFSVDNIVDNKPEWVKAAKRFENK